MPYKQQNTKKKKGATILMRKINDNQKKSHIKFSLITVNGLYSPTFNEY